MAPSDSFMVLATPLILNGRNPIGHQTRPPGNTESSRS
jgi:hypothetical protein